MRELDPGHIYRLKQLGTDATVDLTFIKRSGGAVTYEEEWPGLQVQEVLRALIKRTQYLDSIIGCVESQDTIWHLRMSLWNYEARAWRRKQEGLNRERPEHDDSERSRPHRNNPSNDVPFGLHNRVQVETHWKSPPNAKVKAETNTQTWQWVDIEDLPIGDDGHICKQVIDSIVAFDSPG